MSEASFASLGPTLLARKGGAKPAMRPQLAPLTQNMAEMAALADEQLEDLGWNDMGNDDESEVFAPSAARQADDFEDEKAATGAEPVIGGEVVSIEARMGRPAPANEDSPDPDLVVSPEKQKAEFGVMSGAAMKSADARPMRAASASTSRRRAAFTLRLDAERHLKLRLASTMLNKSAQALVTDALDAALAKIQDLDAIVSRMHRD